MQKRRQSLRRLLKPGKPVFVPERIKPTPWKKWLAPGPMTRRTRAIQEFASRFQGNPFEIARQAVKALSSFERAPMDLPQLKNYYAKRTADQIIRSERIVVASKKFVGARQEEIRVSGCIDLCNALCAVLRARGIPTRFIREMDHSVAHFFSGKEWLRADPLWGTVGVIGKSKESWIERQKRRPKEKAYYTEGLDSCDIGIKSISDFSKFSLH